MTRVGWRECVVESIDRLHQGDPSMLDLLARLLEEQDAAKQALSDKGYGCIGMPWLEVVSEVPS